MKRTLNNSDLIEYGAKLSTLWKVVAIAALVAMGAAYAPRADAAVTFTPSVTTANGKLDTVLTWSAPGATGCTASGHPSWTGAKPITSPAGGFPLPTITTSGTYTLTLACAFAGNTSTTVRWTNPTTNVDGTALTNLQGVRINWGKTPTTMDTVKLTELPAATSWNIGNLAAGDWYFELRAYNSAGLESVPSPTIKKTVVAATSETQSVTLTVNPIPGPVTNVLVEQTP